MKAGIIGAGGISTLHAAAYRAIGVEIVAVADIREEAFLARRSHYPDAAFYPTAEALLADNRVDAVSVCVTNKFHAGVLQAAVRAGKHIYCEKTLSESAQTSHKIAALLDGYGKNFQIGYMKRFFPATQAALRLLPSIGAIFSAHVRSYQGHEGVHGANLYDNDGWRPRNGGPSPTREFADGGMLNMAGSHMIDLICLLLGRPVELYSQNWSPADYDAELASHAMMTSPSGAVIHLDACASPYSRSGQWKDGWDERVEINGKLGRIELRYPLWNNPESNAPTLDHYDEASQTHTTHTFPRTNAFNESIKAFVANCASGTRSIPGVREGVDVDCVISACYQSAATGAKIRL